MHKDNKPCFYEQCRHAFTLKQKAHLWLTRDCSQVNWEEFVCCQVRAKETYSEVKHQFSDRNRDVLINIQFNYQCGPLLSLQCLACVRHCLPWLVRVVDRCMSWLVRLICCQIILTASSPGRLMISTHLPSVSLSYHLCLQVK